MQTQSQPFEIGLWLGRGQAFGVVANHCSAAQAECLRTIRESGAYQSLDLTWDEFCERQVGLSRQTVDALIHKLEDFGETYFHLASIVRISPEIYREIQPRIVDTTLEIEGERVEIAPENAPRIRAAVHRLRVELGRTRSNLATASNRDVLHLQSRYDTWLDDLTTGLRLASTDPITTSSLKALLTYATRQIARLERRAG